MKLVMGTIEVESGKPDKDDHSVTFAAIKLWGMLLLAIFAIGSACKILVDFLTKVKLMTVVIILIALFAINTCYADDTVITRTSVLDQKVKHITELWHFDSGGRQLGLIKWGHWNDGQRNCEVVGLSKSFQPFPDCTARIGLGYRVENDLGVNNHFATLALTPKFRFTIPAVKSDWTAEGVLETCFGLDAAGKTEFRNIAFFQDNKAKFKIGIGGDAVLGAPRNFYLIGLQSRWQISNNVQLNFRVCWYDLFDHTRPHPFQPSLFTTWKF